MVIALTFASVPTAGVFDTDMLYRLQVTTAAAGRVARGRPGPRCAARLRRRGEGQVPRRAAPGRGAGDGLDADRQAKVDFLDFPGGSFSVTVDLDRAITEKAPDGSAIRLFLGGRDDAFFNDLPGFFRSINYAPQFYHVPHTRPDLRELPIPKTLLELEGNHLFNFDPENPQLGRGVKIDLPPGPLTWEGDRFAKDADGNFRFVYSGEDAQAGKNVNAIILELPLRYLTHSPEHDRIVNVWGESWVLKAAKKVETIPDDPLWIEHPMGLLDWHPARRPS